MSIKKPFQIASKYYICRTDIWVKNPRPNDCYYNGWCYKWYKIKSNIILYKQFVHDEDIINLGAIYEKHKVNTSDKLSEALRHYQTLTARNIKKSGGLVAFLSLIISLVALFSTDIIQNNLENIIHTTTAILVALILYWGFNSIINYMNLMFGREQLYTRIENITSEIYMEKLVG